MRNSRAKKPKGMTEANFEAKYGTEDKCRDALFKLRWPDGFICPVCGGTKCSFIKRGREYQCNKCRTQTSVTANTIFHSTKLKLTIWFRCMYNIVTSKNGISSVEMAQRLGISIKSAWSMMHKIMQGMKDQEDKTVLAGNIDMDDAYLGGKNTGGKAGRGSENKIPFIIALEKEFKRRPTCLKLQTVKGFTKKEIAKVGKRFISPKAAVNTDKLSCFRELGNLGIWHRAIKTTGDKEAQDKTFKWINTVLGNVKNSIIGTYHGISKYISRYFASFMFRFNRRMSPYDMMTELTTILVSYPKTTFTMLKAG